MLTKSDYIFIKEHMSACYAVEPAKKTIKSLLKKIDAEIEKFDNEEDNIILCPDRVFTEVHPAILRGNGDCTSMQFYPCIRERCAAYCDGKCIKYQDHPLTNIKKGVKDDKKETT